MFSTILRWVIDRRWLVVIATIIITLWTIYVIPQMQLNVFPPFAPPLVLKIPSHTKSGLTTLQTITN